MAKQNKPAVVPVLNPAYKDLQTIAQIAQQFSLNEPVPFVQLGEVFTNDTEILAYLNSLTYTLESDPLFYVYQKATTNSQFYTALQELLTTILGNTELVSEEVIKLTHKSYKMIGDEEEQNATEYTHELLLDFSDSAASYIAYIFADDGEEPLIIEPDSNTVLLIQSTPAIYRYTNHTQSERLFVRLRFNVINN